MHKKIAALAIGGVVAGTVTAGIASISLWSVIPMSIWAISCGVVGSQSVNILRIASGQLAPTVRSTEPRPSVSER